MTDKVAVFDLEADGLLHDATKMHCACFLNIFDPSDKWYVTTPESAVEALQGLKGVIGMNITDYDFPLLERLTGATMDYSFPYCFDLREASIFLRPGRERPSNCPTKYGPHSLQAWAYRLGLPLKVEIEDWSNLPLEEYIERCEHDCYLQLKVFQALLDEMDDRDGSVRNTVANVRMSSG